MSTITIDVGVKMCIMGHMTTAMAREAAPFSADPKRPGRKIRHAREDMGESIEQLAAAMSRVFDEKVTPQIMKNVESGRTRVDAWRLPFYALHQHRPVAYYVYDDGYTVNGPAAAGGDIPRYLKRSTADVIDIKTRQRLAN